MSLNDRVFGAFENELVRHLSFQFTIVRRVDSSGKPLVQLRVWLRNSSTIVLRNVRGSISPGPAAEFPFTTFYQEMLAPRKDVEIARIEAKIVEPLNDRFAYDRLAQANVSGTPDLSTFRFKDTGCSLSYVTGQIELSAVDPQEQLDSESEDRLGSPTGQPTLRLNWDRISGKKPA